MKARTRGALTVVLVVVACIATVSSVLGLWGQATFLDTGRFTSKAEAIVTDPAVQAAITVELTDRVMELIDLNAFFEDVAPNRGAVVATVLARPMEQFVSRTIASLLEDERFREVFVVIVERAHAAALRLLKGERLLVFSPPGRVTMNLVPMISRVLERIIEVAPGLLPGADELPDVPPSEAAATSIAKLRTALHLPPDATFGQMQLSDIEQIRTAQRIFEVYERSLVLSLVLLVLSVAGAIWLSPRRRAAVVALCLGCSGSLVLVRRAVFALRDQIVGMPVRPSRADAVEAVLDVLLSSLLVASGVLVALLLALALGAALTSPWRWAVALREGARPWIAARRSPLEWGGAVVAVLMLAAFELSGWQLLLLLGVLGLYELAVWVISRRTVIVLPPSPGDGSADGPPVAPDRVAAAR
jgi:hypothetical protein